MSLFRRNRSEPLPSPPTSEYVHSFNSEPTSSSTVPLCETSSLASTHKLVQASGPGPVTPPPIPELTPAAARIIRAIQAIRSCKPKGSDEEEEDEGPDSDGVRAWRRLPCTQNDWDTLHSYIDALGPGPGQPKDKALGDLWGFFHDKVRLDSFCDRGFAVLRMPGYKHDSVLGGLSDYIRDEIRAVIVRGKEASRNKDAAETPAARTVRRHLVRAGRHAENIHSITSANLDFTLANPGEDPISGYHSPDGSWVVRYSDSPDPPLPGLIVEVSHSQKQKDLPFLADHYLLGTGGDDVKLVLAVNLEYRGTGVCVIEYRRKVQMIEGRPVIEVVESEPKVFLEPDGHLVPGQIVLHLSDFGPIITTPEEHQRIVIDFDRLYKFCQFGKPIEAEDDTDGTDVDGKEEELIVPPKADEPNTYKRVRQRSPEQDLGPLDRRFAKDEERVEKKARKEDPTYKGRKE